MDRQDRQIRKLREKAEKLRQGGNIKKALEIYESLRRQDPGQPRWPHQAGELYRKLGQVKPAVDCFSSAAELYHRHGFDVKSVAMCKVLLSLEPLHPTGLTLLEEVSGVPKIRNADMGESSGSGEPDQGPRGASTTPHVLGSRGGGGEDSSRPTRSQATGAPGAQPGKAQSRAQPGKSPPPPPPPKKRSSDELQALELSDLEELIDPADLEDVENAQGPGRSSAAAPASPRAPAAAIVDRPPARQDTHPSKGSPSKAPPPPPGGARPGAPAQGAAGSPGESMEIAIEVEGYDAVLGGSSPGKSGGDAPGGASDSRDPMGVRLGQQEPGSPAGDASSSAAGSGLSASPKQTVALTMDELEILDEEDVAFMEAIEDSAVSDHMPSKTPTLEPNAPLESLDLRDVMHGRQRHPSEPNIGALYEIDLDEPEPTTEAEEVPDYTRRLTPTRGLPNLTTSGLFKGLGIDATRSMLARMNFVEKESGEVIIRQGEVGGSLYVIVRGEVRILKELGDTTQEIARLIDGEIFGEMALITDTPRVATVEATTDVELLEISRATLRSLIQDYPRVVPALIRFLKDRLLEIFVKTSELLAPIPEDRRWQLARKFRFYELSEGNRILREGKPSGGLFILLSGDAVATRQRRGKTVKLADLGPGSVIGEISIVTGGPAVATVTTTTKTWLLAISDKQFEAIGRAFPDMRAYVQKLAEQRHRENAAILAGEPAYISQNIRMI